MGSGSLYGVLVTFRRPEQLALMLKHLDEQTRRIDRLVVIDNDLEESARPIVSTAPAVEYIASGDNRGPAGGLALGMCHVLATAHDDDWVVLLDDDDPPRTRDMVARLASFGEELRSRDSSVAAVGKSGTRFDRYRARTMRVPDDALAGAVPADCIGGGQLPFYSVHAIRAVGVFDERLFFGFDDLEYGLRLRALGFRIYVHGDMWYEDRVHHGRLSMDVRRDRRLGEAGWRRYYSIRNLIYILRKRGHPMAALRLASRSLVKPLYSLPREPALAVRHLRLAGRAVTDAYRGRMGRTLEPHGPTKLAPRSR